MSEGLLNLLIITPILITLVVVFSFRGKGPSVNEAQERDH